MPLRDARAAAVCVRVCARAPRSPEIAQRGSEIARDSAAELEELKVQYGYTSDRDWWLRKVKQAASLTVPWGGMGNRIKWFMGPIRDDRVELIGAGSLGYGTGPSFG